MRSVLLFFTAILLVASCTKQTKYTILGTVADNNQTTIYLQQRVNGAFKNIDSTQLINGKFKFTGKVEVPDVYYLSKGDNDKKIIFLENCKTSITADSLVLAHSKITGGKAQQLFNTYQTTYDQMDEYLMKVYDQWKQEQNTEVKKKLESQVDSLDEVVTKYQESFMIDHSASPVAAYLLTQIQYGKDGEELGKLLSKLDNALNRTVSYKAIAERVEALMRVAVGQKAPDFTLNDIDGNPVVFSQEYIKNKYTLIDFWASWCSPCRAENPNVVAAFKQFSNNGFSVFGVSLDKEKGRWLKAIADDQLSWQHVSDLKGWGNEAAKEYSVNSIPANFLVDQNGMIVAFNLQGEELMKKLEELLR